MLANDPEAPDALFGEILFPQALLDAGFVAAPLTPLHNARPPGLSLPPTWSLETALHLQGPLGKGFRLPGSIHNLALVALGDTAARLLPLLSLAENIVLFAEIPLPALPPGPSSAVRSETSSTPMTAGTPKTEPTQDAPMEMTDLPPEEPRFAFEHAEAVFDEVLLASGINRY